LTICDVFTHLIHSADEHKDKRHDEKYQLAGRKYETFDIHLPSRSGQQGFSYQTIFQQDAEILKNWNTSNLCFNK
jgi:hypothetical protein